MKNLTLPLLALAGLLQVPLAQAADNGAIVGAAVGGAVGAAIGQQANGKNGAVVGAAIGSATGAAIGSNQKPAQKVVEPAAHPRTAPVYVRERRDEDRGEWRRGGEHHDHGKHRGHRKHHHH